MDNTRGPKLGGEGIPKIPARSLMIEVTVEAPGWAATRRLESNCVNSVSAECSNMIAACRVRGGLGLEL